MTDDLLRKISVSWGSKNLKTRIHLEKLTNVYSFEGSSCQWKFRAHPIWPESEINIQIRTHPKRKVNIRISNMSKAKILGISLLALFVIHIWRTTSASATNSLPIESDENEVAEKSLECLQKYFAFRFKEMSRARFDLIRRHSLRQTRVEHLFLRKSNRKFSDPISLTTLASIDGNQLKNYLIFLSSEDVDTLRNISIPTAYVNSFLYIVYEQNNANVSMADIHTIFASSFKQNVVIMMISQTNQDTIEWNAFRVVLLKCRNMSEYKMVKISQCSGAREFKIFPLRHFYTAACPVQVFGRHLPPFTYYNPLLGLYDGIEYHLFRAISSHFQMPMSFTFLNGTMISKTYVELSGRKNLTAQRRKNANTDLK